MVCRTCFCQVDHAAFQQALTPQGKLTGIGQCLQSGDYRRGPQLFGQVCVDVWSVQGEVVKARSILHEGLAQVKVVQNVGAHVVQCVAQGAGVVGVHA